MLAFYSSFETSGKIVKMSGLFLFSQIVFNGLFRLQLKNGSTLKAEGLTVIQHWVAMLNDSSLQCHESGQRFRVYLYLGGHW